MTTTSDELDVSEGVALDSDTLAALGSFVTRATESDRAEKAAASTAGSSPLNSSTQDLGWEGVAAALGRWHQEHPIHDLPVGDFLFFPSGERPDQIDSPAWGDMNDCDFPLAAGPVRRIVVTADGELIERHHAGQRTLPFTLQEVVAMATPWVGAKEERVADGALQFLPPPSEQEVREALGARFDAARDLFGITLLADLKTDLEQRRAGAKLSMGIGAALLGGVVLISLAIDNVALKAVAAVLLGCVPLTILALGRRALQRADGHIAELKAHIGDSSSA